MHHSLVEEVSFQMLLHGCAHAEVDVFCMHVDGTGAGPDQEAGRVPTLQPAHV